MSLRNFALVFGIFFMLAGILGFIPGVTTAPHAHAPDLRVGANYGNLLGLFPVNVLHNFVHIIIGIWGLAAARKVPSARLYGRSVAVIYGVLTVMGLFPVLNTTFGLIPLFSHDIWLHAVSALVAGYFGFVHREAGEPTRGTPLERPIVS